MKFLSCVDQKNMYKLCAGSDEILGSQGLLISGLSGSGEDENMKSLQTSL